MSRSSSITWRWFINYLCFHLLNFLFLSTFFTFSGARPTSLDPNTCKEPYVIKKGVSVLGTDNHLVLLWDLCDATGDAFILGSGDHLSRQRHVIRRDGLKDEDQGLILNVKSHLEQLKTDVRHGEAEQMVKPDLLNHLVSVQDDTLRCDEGEDTLVLSKDNNLEPMMKYGTGEALVLNTENNLVSLRHVIRHAEDKDSILVLAATSIKRGAGKYSWEKDTIASIQEMVRSKLAEKADEADKTIQTTRQDKSYQIDGLGNGFMFGKPSATFRQTASIQGLSGEVGAQSHASALSFIWDFGTTTTPVSLAEQTFSPEKSMASGSDSTTVTYNKTQISPLDIPTNFSRVVGIAAGLGILLAIPSLFMICALSRKGQYVWIRTININQEQLITPRRRDRANHDGDSSVTTGEGWDQVSSRQDSGNPRISGTTAGQVIVNKDRSWFYQRWLDSISDQFNILRRSEVFLRWFGWGSTKVVKFENSSSRGPAGNGRKIKSARTRRGNRAPDPTAILTEVAERLIRERMRQLSTILSVDEGQAQPTTTGIGGEELSMDSITAVVTGSKTGTQSQNNTMRRNRQGIQRVFGELGGVGSSRPVAVCGCGDVDSNTHEDGLTGIEGNESQGKASQVVRFDDSTDKMCEKGKEAFERVSIREYISPTVEDDISSTEEASPPENLDCGTIVKKEQKGEKTGGLWENMFEVTSGDTAVGTDSPVSGGTGIELERQAKKSCEVDGSGSGTESSFDDDSTPTANSDDNVELVVVGGRLLVQEKHKSTPEEALQSDLSVDSGPVLDQAIRAELDMGMLIGGVVSDEYGVSAFGIQQKSPRWDSSDDSQLSSGYFTGSSSDREVMDAGPDIDSFHLMDLRQK